MDSELRESLYDLPPCVKLVFKVLEEGESLTRKELASRAFLSPRTARYALNELQEIGVVTDEINFLDARQRIYSLSLEDPETAAVPP